MTKNKMVQPGTSRRGGKSWQEIKKEGKRNYAKKKGEASRVALKTAAAAATHLLLLLE
jgi:hypothetical protein